MQTGSTNNHISQIFFVFAAPMYWWDWLAAAVLMVRYKGDWRPNKKIKGHHGQRPISIICHLPDPLISHWSLLYLRRQGPPMAIKIIKVHFKHPRTQWKLRSGRWSSVELSTFLNLPILGLIMRVETETSFLRKIQVLVWYDFPCSLLGAKSDDLCNIKCNKILLVQKTENRKYFIAQRQN